MLEKFLSKAAVGAPNECWEWQAYISPDGYGRVSIDGKKAQLAHRVSYELHCESIPDHKYVMHTCDNRRCVNPNHLKVGSPHDNVIDMFDKQRNPPRNLLKGSAKGTNILVEEDVIEIRRLLESGMSNQEVADQFNVSKATIGHIRTRRNWGWL